MNEILDRFNGVSVATTHTSGGSDIAAAEVDKLRDGSDPARTAYAYSTAQQAPAAPQWAAPPSPPKASSCDFLNVIENYDSYGYDSYDYESATAPAAAAAPYTPSRSLREVCEEDGILDLEEDGAVVKEVAGQYSAPRSGGARSITAASSISPAAVVVTTANDSHTNSLMIFAATPSTEHDLAYGGAQKMFDGMPCS